MDPESIYNLVNEQYTLVAQNTNADQAHASNVAQAFGYDAADLQSLPDRANMGLSCGNPLATANLRPGEVVIDLGSGGGLDVIFAARKVRATGKVIGVDRSHAMLDLATRNAARAGVAENTAFIEASITAIPLPDRTADCIISNCVVNLVPDVHKPRVFREMYRLLKPGGRVAISDILAKRELPARIRDDAALLVGCIAGASQVQEYRRMMEDAGFGGIILADTGSDVNVYNEGGSASSCCGTSDGVSGDVVEASPQRARSPDDDEVGKGSHPGVHQEHISRSTCCSTSAARLDDNVAKAGLQSNGIDLNEWVGSFRIYAIKAAS